MDQMVRALVARITSALPPSRKSGSAEMTPEAAIKWAERETTLVIRKWEV
jgi:hypothetical protein